MERCGCSLHATLEQTNLPREARLIIREDRIDCSSAAWLKGYKRIGDVASQGARWVLHKKKKRFSIFPFLDLLYLPAIVVMPVVLPNCLEDRDMAPVKTELLQQCGAVRRLWEARGCTMGLSRGREYFSHLF
ncbi:hypothetical protein MANES_06G043401v8 [Manihot esculenta]|uniref:Uncharacterized protein n=1 Tax=Manihot esculenta TaxID=3983 RepID=A0ACB7HHI0_MANES|nr:hypothetical protein MANES_06G043401v8 [Manihot esculenta]